VPQKGGGRKRKVNTIPQIHITFRRALDDHTAGSPQRDDLLWTNLSQQQIADRLRAAGVDVSPRVVAQLLDEHDFHRRRLFKSLPLGRFAHRDAQFQHIAQVKRDSLAAGLPVLSLDTKKRELLGPFDRPGWLYSPVRQRVYDHDFPRFAAGVVIPHGIYDLRHNRGYVHLGTSHDTSAFACDCLGLWWEGHGRLLYPAAAEVVLLCDGGGSNSARTYLFKADLQALADRIGRTFRVLHYPPYCSKWNPIEHRLFPHLSRACRGAVLSSVELVKQLLERAGTRTGLRVVVEIVRAEYATGRRVSAEVKRSLNLHRDDFLPQLNYRIRPGRPNREVIS
jgi:Rhodopirellula transposase DDE domain